MDANLVAGLIVVAAAVGLIIAFTLWSRRIIEHLYHSRAKTSADQQRPPHT